MRCLLFSLIASISELILAFLSFNFLFSFFKLMNRSRSHSIFPSDPLSFISGSFTTLFKKTLNLVWLSSCYFRSVSSSYFALFCCSSWCILAFSSFTVSYAWASFSSSFFRLSWFLTMTAISDWTVSVIFFYVSTKSLASLSSCFAF